MDTNQLAQLLSPTSPPPQLDSLSLAQALGYGAPPAASVAPPAPLADSTRPDLSAFGISQPAASPGGPDASQPTPAPGQVVDPWATGNQLASAGPGKPSGPLPGLAPGQSVGAGQSVSAEGYSPGAMAAIQAGPGKQVRKEINADQAATEAEWNPLLQQQAVATAQEQAAAAGEANADSKKILAQSEATAKIGAAQQDYVTKEQALIAQSKTEADAAQAQYRASLMDFAAQSVNPSQLWDQAGGTGQFSMIATAFMHDFLGARGIQTSGLDSIRQAIQNNISAQVQNINNKREVSAGFKTLWDMQRAQSATDAEARQRVFGFYLQGLTNELQGKLGTYDSELAQAKGQSAIAKLSQEQVKNDALVRQHIDMSANQKMQNRVALIGHELAASSAKYTADMHLKAAQIAAGQKNTQSPLVGLLVDRNGTAYRRFLPDVEKKTADDLRGETQKIGETVNNIEKLIELQAPLSKIAPGGVVPKNLYDEAQRAAEQLRNITKMSIIYDNSGKQINEQEIKMYDQILSKKDWFLDTDNVRTFGILGKTMLDKVDAKTRGYTVEITPDDPAYGFNVGKRQFDPANATLTDIQAAPGAGRHANSPVESQVKTLYSPDAKQPAAAEATDSGNLSHWAQMLGDQDFRGKLPPAAGEALRTDLVGRGPTVDPKNLGAGVKSLSESPDKAFVQLDKLAEAAISGDGDARQAIQNLAAAHNAGHKLENQDLIQAYALWEDGRVHDVLSRTGAETPTPEEAAAQPQKRTFTRNDGTTGEY